jgi:serine/threonine-protein kinase
MIREVADFYGRRREVAKIFARIGASRPQSVAIVGDRRIGKSSLLHHLCHPEIRSHYLENPDSYAFVLIDLQEQRDIGIAAFFENLFRGIEQAVGRPRPAQVQADYEGARQALLHLQEERRKIILLFDEFDAITRNPNFPEEFFAFLRAVANKYDMAYVTTSSRDLQQLCHAERIADSPFFNIFSNLFLTRFEPDEALALIREPSAAAGIPLAPHADEIIDLGGLFPFFLQMACAAFFEHLAEGIDCDIDRIRAAFREEAEPHFAYIREHMDEDQRGVLRDLADGHVVQPSRVYLLTKLKRDGYLLEDNGRERLFSSVFAHCLQEASFRPVKRPGGGDMTTERLHRIEALYHELRARPMHERAAALVAASPEDAALRAEVQSLLDQADSAIGFLSMPPGAAGVPLANSIVIGRRVGIFEVQALLGVGGMGEVYRARDTRLGRDVAMKILPRVFREDPARVARFEREAQVLAVLNHPHIGAVYGLEQADGVNALVMELVEGEDLSARIARGPIPVREALAIARQIAEALEAAHDQRIVHRDLKPANIKVRRDGTIKILDFGLAKALALPSENDPTLPGRGTQAGTVMGTPAYMSPEQARGDDVSRQADIWSFGTVLFEMLTGVSPFARPTMADTLASVLGAEPDSALLPRDVPPVALRVLRRCLEKDLKRRLQHIGDARIEIEEALAALTPGAAAGPQVTARTAFSHRWVWLVGVLGVAAILILLMARSCFS